LLTIHAPSKRRRPWTPTSTLYVAFCPIRVTSSPVLCRTPGPPLRAQSIPDDSTHWA